METLRSYIAGEWVAGTGKPATLVNPSTEEPLAETGTEGVDFGAALRFARERGGPALFALTFRERGELLRGMSRAIHDKRDELIELAMKNGGNTRSDAKFDIDGASGTLAAYADLGAELGERRWLLDGDAVQLGRSPRFVGQHILLPRRGAAVHINAFNFPAWGLAEKAACALLAGMPVVSKPATSTAVVAHRIMQLVVDAKVLPAGALQFVCGSPGDLLSRLDGQDVLAFTGGGSTAATLRALAPVVKDSVRVNIEADSLNAAILGLDVEPGSDTYNMFLRDVARDITQKTGQKCTAIRRIFVPEAHVERVVEDLADRLGQTVTGNPEADGVSMGPLATASQLRDVREGIERLDGEAKRVVGGGAFEPVGAPKGKGYFVPPTLFLHSDAAKARAVHEHEVFGPVGTVLAYSDTATMTEWVRRGGGGLVSSLYSDDRGFSAEALFGIAAHHGRVMMGSEKIAEQAPGPGTVLPQMVHGGPGRAGGGEELGGIRGLSFYSQRTAVQGARPILEAILVGKS
jgi:3,4-dehydroadipyl-CoA semialdehyde dehydrogenase